MFYFTYSKLPFCRKLVIICILIRANPSSRDRALNEATSSTADYSIAQQRKAAEYDNQIESKRLNKKWECLRTFRDIELNILSICTKCTNPQKFFKLSAKAFMHSDYIQIFLRDLIQIGQLLMAKNDINIKQKLQNFCKSENKSLWLILAILCT